MTSGILRLVLPRHRSYQDVIDRLEMQRETWVRGMNWLRKPTLFTLVELDPETLYLQMTKAYEQGFIDDFSYEWRNGKEKRLHARMKGNWFRKWL